MHLYTRLLHCLKCRKNTESENQKVVKKKTWNIRLLSTYPCCNSKKSKFIKEQGTSELVCNLEKKTSLTKVPLVGHLLL